MKVDLSLSIVVKVWQLRKGLWAYLKNRPLTIEDKYGKFN